MNNKLVSLVIPIYNAENSLVKCIDSILKQTYNNIEIILVNDGSTDGSSIICEEFKAKDARVEVIHQKNAGPSTARNAGVQNSKGDYLQFVDADDHIDLTMVEKLIYACKNGVDLVLCGYYVNSIESTEVIPNYEGEYSLTEFMGLFTELYKKTLIPSPGNKLYNVKIIKENDIKFPVNLKNGEDLMFNIEYLQYCKVISLLKLPLYHYNVLVNPSSLSKIYRKNIFENVKITYSSLSNFLGNYTEEYPLLNNILEQAYSNTIIRSIMNLFHEENKLSFKKRKEEISKIVEDKWVSNNIDKIEKNKYHGVFIRFLFKYKLISLIHFYFYMRKTIKKLLNEVRYFFLKKDEY